MENAHKSIPADAVSEVKESQAIKGFKVQNLGLEANRQPLQLMQHWHMFKVLTTSRNLIATFCSNGSF